MLLRPKLVRASWLDWESYRNFSIACGILSVNCHAGNLAFFDTVAHPILACITGLSSSKLLRHLPSS